MHPTMKSEKYLLCTDKSDHNRLKSVSVLKTKEWKFSITWPINAHLLLIDICQKEGNLGKL